MIKTLKNRVIDCVRPMGQVILVLSILVLPLIINVAGIIQRLFIDNKLDFDTVKYYYLMRVGNFWIGVIIAGYIFLKFIRPSNKEIMINTGNIYHEHCYAWYWFCSKILGYYKCSLVRVPISMQFKLIIRDTFNQYVYGLDSEYKEVIEDPIRIDKTITDKSDSCINIVLADTYPLDKNLLPESTKNISTIYIQRENNKTDSVRCYSKDFIETVLNTVRHLPNNIHIVNLYPATNPKHNYYIVQGVFKMADRSNINRLVIYPQKRKNEKWNFSDKGVKIY